MHNPAQRATETDTQRVALRPGEHPLPLLARGERLSAPQQQKPEWLKVRVEHGDHYRDLKGGTLTSTRSARKRAAQISMSAGTSGSPL